MAEKQKKKGVPETDCILEILSDAFKGIETNTCDFSAAFYAQAYSSILLKEIQKCTITPNVVNFAARLYLMHVKEPVLAVMFIDRKMRISGIENLAENYRPVFTDFIDEITETCKSVRTKRCIIIYNYEYKTSPLEQLVHLDRLYCGLKNKGIILADVVQILNGDAVSKILPYEKSGYDHIK